jgi:hypothetical protein
VRPRGLLVDTLTHLSPPRVLEGLTSEAAERRLPGAPHSIAEIVAHMSFWQDWFTDRCRGIDAPMAAHAALGWRDVAPGAWPGIQARFCTGLDALVA